VSTLGVGAYDVGGFLLRLTRASVGAGQLTIFFRNYDVSDHNLWIEGPGGDVVERISDAVGEGGGGSRTLTVTPGSWRLFCSLPDHGAMTRALTVTP
jgi:predicted enzyme related to lactoylglutathione lyase